ncbi:oxidoreductase yjgI [Mycobacteroides abscessus subsp. bolletii]|uniref:SDR family NAD(P)-dependent oxidoreductase n=1 Tax=Mycobacteroides abscessus TaxID=36809 RepID=UPI0009A90D41|nr:SDR family oxidoreductase [Mycobacteroides abscessus]SKG71316.1 oxidoreductase yjgI [Mycobacteroides abscessus subsp. bolletii]SKH11212.1 oxidoreductase yjgI [Mycobacteroides abscessus subsp. bolletii]
MKSAEVHSAIVFGGGGGIGAAVAAVLAGSHAVIVGCHHHHQRAQAVADKISAGGRVAQMCASDAATTEGVAAAIEAAQRLGTLRTVVHCVGAWHYRRVAELTEDVIDADYRTNLRSALLTLSAAANHVADHGRIVMVSSAAAHLAPARQASYVAMKLGVEGAARATAKELGRRNITVNVIRPGATDTETLHAGTDPQAVEAMSKANVFRRLGTPQDIANAVGWLTSPDAQWITGAVIDATGGLW